MFAFDNSLSFSYLKTGGKNKMIVVNKVLIKSLHSSVLLDEAVKCTAFYIFVETSSFLMSSFIRFTTIRPGRDCETALEL